jgi:HD-like signal output (HDOD) protein
MSIAGVQGSFADLSLGHLLHWMERGRHSGRLDLDGPGLCCRLGFLRGHILEARRRNGPAGVEVTREAQVLGPWLREPLDWTEGTFVFRAIEVQDGAFSPGIEVQSLLQGLRPAQGPPPVEPTGLELETKVVEVLLHQGYSMPVLSETALRVQRLARDPRAAVRAVAEVVSADPVLSGAVLRAANSAALGREVAIDSLPLAVTRLGFRAILSLSYATCLQSKPIRIPALRTVQHRIWSHSLAVALLARHVAVAARVDDEQAFLCGLLHDLGEAILLGIVEELVVRKQLSRPPSAGELQPLVDGLHDRVGRTLPLEWKLPESVVHTLLFHHKPKVAPEASRKVVAVVALADLMARHLEERREPPDAVELAQSVPATILSLEPNRLEPLLRAAEPMAAQSRQLVG